MASLNGKGFENPVFLKVLEALHRESTLVSLIAPEDVREEHLESTRFWMVVGGDGTLNGAVNAMMKVPPQFRRPICYLPSGTGNDFARSVGLDNKDPLEIVKDVLQGKGFQKLTVGRCNADYLINVATGGLFATVTPEANPQLKQLTGRLSYFLHGIGKMAERQTFPMRIDEGEEIAVLGFFVGNARYVGGGIQVTPDADPFDRTLQFLAIPEMPTKELLSLGLELQKEEPDLSGYPVVHRKVRELKLSFHGEIPINLDGEQIKTKEAKFTVHPEAVEVYVPHEIA
ncbi:MAG: YegS/Rv2252/BmrU family lipid kinase [Bdellovibrionaceae bacterium]|nr:YegS/Rv2252/BmrU family lipid kinase [Pseudobdellovibrionaceae bacterium]